MNAAKLFTAGALALARVMYPPALEKSYARRFARNADGVIVGAEPIDLPRAGAPALLVLHGGGDTPQSMRGLATFLHGRGYAIRAPLLECHGRYLRDMARCDAEQWKAQVHDEFKSLRARHEWVGVVGQSVGGALALELAASVPDVKALVLLAPWVAMKTPMQFAADTSRIWGWVFPYLPSLGGGHSIHDPEQLAQVLTSGIVTPAQMRALAEVARFADAALPNVQAATLTMQSREDGRISSDVAQRAFDRLGAKDKRFEWLTGAGHVISVDYGKERVFELAAEWLDAHRNQ